MVHAGAMRMPREWEGTDENIDQRPETYIRVQKGICETTEIKSFDSQKENLNHMFRRNTYYICQRVGIFVQPHTHHVHQLYHEP